MKIEELQESAPGIFKPLDTTTIAIQRVGNKKTQIMWEIVLQHSAISIHLVEGL